jgi:hypothetical protein
MQRWPRRWASWPPDEGLRQSYGLAARAEVQQRTWTAIGDELSTITWLSREPSPDR